MFFNYYGVVYIVVPVNAIAFVLPTIRTGRRSAVARQRHGGDIGVPTVRLFRKATLFTPPQLVDISVTLRQGFRRRSPACTCRSAVQIQYLAVAQAMLLNFDLHGVVDRDGHDILGFADLLIRWVHVGPVPLMFVRYRIPEFDEPQGHGCAFGLWFCGRAAHFFSVHFNQIFQRRHVASEWSGPPGTIRVARRRQSTEPAVNTFDLLPFQNFTLAILGNRVLVAREIFGDNFGPVGRLDLPDFHAAHLWSQE